MSTPKERLGGAVAPEDLKDFYYLRHGTTHLNKIVLEIAGEKHWGVQGGGTNSDLIEEGKAQSHMAGHTLRHLTLEHVFCSPLGRAIQTIVLARPDLASTFLDLLKEQHYGDYEGRLGPLKLFEEGLGNSEKKVDAVKRAAEALKYVRKPNTLLVGHGNFLRDIGGLLEVDLLPEHLQNGVVLHFQRKGSVWTVRALCYAPVVLVSGASRGIGLAIARDLQAHGYRLSLGARNVADLEREFGPETAHLHYARFEAEDPSTIDAWVSNAAAKFERIDGLVNNAAAGVDLRVDLMDDNPEGLAKVMKINFEAPCHLARLCMPYLKAAKHGRIITISSLSALRVKGSTNLGYNASKSALHSLSEMVRVHGWEHGVRATSICPGWVRTDMSVHATGIKREDMTAPDDIARIVRFAIECPDNAAIATIPVNCELEPLF